MLLLCLVVSVSAPASRLPIPGSYLCGLSGLLKNEFCHP